jgi:hypothetical protein
MANNIEKLLGILIEPSQSVEDALQQLMYYRFVDTAVGAQLDIIGRIVGQSRDGLSDDDYRRYIRARVAVNNSNGTFKDLLTVAFLVVYDETAYFEATNSGIATVILRVRGIAISQALAQILITFLGDTVAAGVRVILEYSDQNPSTWFQWDTVGRGWDNGKFVDALDNSGTEGS